MRDNLRWPANGLNGYAPWYTIAWRIAWLPLVLVLGIPLYLVILAHRGLYEAERFRRYFT